MAQRALIGVIVGQRHLVMTGGFAMVVMNGHDVASMGLIGGPADAAMAGLVFAAVAIVLVWRKPAAN